MKKLGKILLAIALATFISSEAIQAAQVNGTIGFTGTVSLNTGSAGTASAATAWHWFATTGDPIVALASQDFAGLDNGAHHAHWPAMSFNSGPVPSFWSVGGFVFDLSSSTITNQTGVSVTVSMNGVVSGNGFDPTPCIASFTLQDPPAGGVWTFSASFIAQPCTGTIGDFVWNDLNGNGIQDAGEPGINGVTVVLKDSTGTMVLQTVVTMTHNGMMGYYQFTGLCANTYQVSIDNSQPALAGAGFLPTTVNAPGSTTANDSNPNPSTVVLPTDNSSDQTIDFGYIQCTGTIGDRVWNDLNGDGCQDPGEPGIPGVTVDLYAGCTGSYITSVTTDANGNYLFEGLCDGTYSVRFHTPNGFTHTLANQACNVGGQPSDETDSDCDCTGTADCNVCPVTLSSGHRNDLTIDCGYIGPCTGSIGDFVWNDLNGNGCQDPGEPGIPGVTVILSQGCPAGTQIASTTTDSGGHYEFTDLCAGSYTVHFQTPSGFTHTIPNQGCGGTPGDPHNPNDSNCNCTGTADCDVCVDLPINGSDQTIDCGYVSPPLPLPCPAGLFLGGKTTGGSSPGDILIAFDQFPAPNDNSYGTNSIGWGNKGHQFKDLTGSDKAGFQILRPNGTVAVSFNVDYITASTLNLPPSGYRSLGPFGGDGSIVSNSTPALVNNGTQITWDTSLARNLNGPAVWGATPTWPTPTYFMGGTQTIGTSGPNSALLTTNSPPVDCSLASDPSTCLTTYGTPRGSQYPLAGPTNPWNASYNNAEYAVVPIGSSSFENAIARHVDGWNFHDSFFVTFKQTYLTAIGFDFTNYAIATYDAATNTFTCPPSKWCVAPNPTALHNSPPKACPIPETVVVGTKTLSKKAVQITLQNNTTTGQVITGLAITWPQATNGNLLNIKLGGTTIYNTSTGGGTLTTSSLLGTAAQRTIAAAAHQNLIFNFQNNVDTNASHYTGSATFNPFGNVTILP